MRIVPRRHRDASTTNDPANYTGQAEPRKVVSNRWLQPGIYLESTLDEQQGLLPGEARRVKDVMISAVTVASQQTSLKEATALMKDLAVPVIVV